jgi:hypothetical protein
VRADELGHLKHGDLVFAKNHFELGIGVDVALVCCVLLV